MAREFMQSLPLEVKVKDENGEHRIGDDDTIFCLTIQDCITYLRNSREFHDSPTEEMMIMILKKYVAESIITLREDADWYIRLAMPEFLKKDIQR